jgi:hypothetical protein
MAYTSQEGYYTVGDLGADAEPFVQKYKWYLAAAAVLAAAGAGYYYYNKKAAGSMYGLDDISDCGCDR